MNAIRNTVSFQSESFIDKLIAAKLSSVAG